MKQSILFYIITIYSLTVQEIHCQSLTMDLVKDFGARGDGITDDTDAWNKAIRFFSNKLPDGKSGAHNIDYQSTQGILVIPAGTYRIGAQLINKDSTKNLQYAQPKASKNALWGVNGKGLIIKGVRGKGTNYPTKIKFLDGLLFGYFDPKSNKPSTTESGKYNEASIGFFLEIDWNCKNVTIQDIELDGNSDKAIIGGPGSSSGIQLPYSGIRTNAGVQGILLSNIYCHHFGLDGFFIGTSFELPAKQEFNLIMEDCKSEYNGRQALSWCYGTGFYAKNSSFQFTGMGKTQSSPSANVDIENQDRYGKTLSKGLFENCTISSNRSKAGSLNFVGKIDNVTFENCTISSGDPSAENTNRVFAVASHYSTSRNFKFYNCTLTGNIDMQRNGKKMELEGTTLFKNCKIIDNQNFKSTSRNRFLVNVYDNVQFDSCTFFIDKRRKFINSAKTNINDAKRNTIILNNCSFLDIQTKKDIAKVKMQLTPRILLK
jgi:hypothetical protein